MFTKDRKQTLQSPFWLRSLDKLCSPNFAKLQQQKVLKKKKSSKMEDTLPSLWSFEDYHIKT